MAAASSTDDSKLYVRISEGSKHRLVNKNFNYPLLLSYRIFTYDQSTNKEIVIYTRAISIQKGSQDGLKLHLSTLEKLNEGYRLSAEGVDNDNIKYEAIASIALLSTGLIKETKARHLNTIVLKIKT
jgi:hypothetical protein